MAITKITYRQHLIRRLKERKIPKDYPKQIYIQSKKHYFDKDSGHFVAVLKLYYADKFRNMAAVYDKIDQNIEIITNFPISTSELSNKINSGRWIKNEEG